MKLYQPGTWQETNQLRWSKWKVNQGATSLKVGWLREPARGLKHPETVATAGSLNRRSQGPATRALKEQGNNIVPSPMRAETTEAKLPWMQPLLNTRPLIRKKCPNFLLLPHKIGVSQQPNPDGSQPGGGRLCRPGSTGQREMGTGRGPHMEITVTSIYLVHLLL